MQAEETQQPKNEPEPIWAVAANVVLERPYGRGGEETRRGTKHFRAGAKVVCVRFFWDAELTNVLVVGHQRSSNKLISTIVRCEWLANWRTELIYNPRTIERIKKYVAENGLTYLRYDGSEEARLEVEEIVSRQLPEVFRSHKQPYVSTRGNDTPPG